MLQHSQPVTAHIWPKPLLRKSVEGREDTLTEEEALKIIENSMRALYYRDARSHEKVILFFNHSEPILNIII